MRRFVAVVVLRAGLEPFVLKRRNPDRATFDAISPSYLEYVRGDELLDEEQIDRRVRLIDSWRIRIEKAEGGGT